MEQYVNEETIIKNEIYSLILFIYYIIIINFVKKNIL